MQDADNHPVEDEIRRSVHALSTNRMYQALLQEQLRRIELAIKLNEEILSELRTKTSKRNKTQGGESEIEGAGEGGDGGGGRGGGGPRQRVLYVPLTPSPYFVDPLGHRPPDNEDTHRLRTHLSTLPRYVQPKKWTEAELNSLAQAVRQQSQQILVNQLYERYQRPDAGSLEDFNREMARIRNMSESELEMQVEGIDWDIVARTCLPHRTAEECRLKWLRQVSPHINRAMWSSEEDESLLQLAQRYGATHWELIAQQLGTHRTPAQCFMRFQRSLNNKITNSKWTDEEDRLLALAVKKYGEKNWQQVANTLMSRTGQQALHRWRNTLNPNIKRGKWELVEDVYLTLSVQAYRGNLVWRKIQRHVPCRTDVQCRERWANVLNPELKVDPWTKEEDAKLLASIQRHGLGNWCLVAKDLAPRTDNQCWRRWKQLAGEANVNAYRFSARQRKALAPSNFQGRSKERPLVLMEEVRTYPSFVDSSAMSLPTAAIPLNSDHEFERMRKRRLLPSPGLEQRDSQSQDQEQKQSQEVRHYRRRRRDRESVQRLTPRSVRRAPLFGPDQRSPEDALTFTVDRDVNIQFDRPLFLSSVGFSDTEEEKKNSDDPDTVVHPSLPLVLPSSATFQALRTLLLTLDRVPLPDKNGELLDRLLTYTETPEFKLLAAWFNSLFLYPDRKSVV